MLALKAAVSGVVVTLLSGLYNSTPPGLVVGAAWYGLPLTWVRRLVVAPQYNPWKIGITGLIVDLIFWIVIAGVVIFVITYAMSSKKPKKRKSR